MDRDIAENSILLKDNRIYNHKLVRFYHTAYDVRRSEDVINPKTPHCNIMLLSSNASKPDDSSSDSTGTTHPFIYARVIGVYHTNVVYIGPGMSGYKPIRFEFLHVRWFKLDPLPENKRAHRHSDRTSFRLDRLTFPPMNLDDSFSFLDPSLVLRACHIIPAYNFGKLHADGVGHSAMAMDGDDWNSYYVNR